MANLYTYHCPECGEVFRARAWESACPRPSCLFPWTEEQPEPEAPPPEPLPRFGPACPHCGSLAPDLCHQPGCPALGQELPMV